MTLLESINTPEELRTLPRELLPRLAAEIRAFMIDVVSAHGGHLASSLGTVELTIALHYVYATPDDKLLWDVGHQAYTHKILCGRRTRFATLRQFDGISGFPRIGESEWDAISAGHASTSISAGLGMAIGRDLRKEKHNVVAIIGDGSLSGGLAFEGLNNLGAQSTRMTVVLNDNEMSISKNVGALSRYLLRVITDKRFNKIKKEVWELLGHMSHVGKGIRSLVHNVDDAMKHFVIPGKLFEDLGLKYFGPVDGHNINELIEVFEFIKNNEAVPSLVHVVTKKGKGYPFAEEDATKYHGIGKFSPNTGNAPVVEKKTPSFSDVFGEAMVEIAREHTDVVAITAAMPDGTGLTKFKALFPGRLFDVGIAEGHALTFAAGLARAGLSPVVAIYSTFLQRAYDQVIHDIALDKLPVVICIDRAGLVGEDGPTHHGTLDISFLRAIPNMLILAPRDEQELRNMLYTVITRREGPVCIRYPRGTGTGAPVDQPFATTSLADPTILQQGNSCALITVGPMAETGRKAALLLESERISLTRVDARVLKPLNAAFYAENFAKHSLIFTLEDNTIAGGFGSAILELAADLGSSARVVRLGCPDAFVTHGATEKLREELHLTPALIAARIKKTINDQ
jgi:1-deoxy-D-xylulose-5-phosphate synthase